MGISKSEVRWWIAGVVLLFVVLASIVVLKQDGGYRHFLYILDGAEVAGTLFVAALGTFLTIWHSSVFFGLLFVLATLLVLSRTGRLRMHATTIAFFTLWIGVACMVVWHIARQHLSVPGGLLLGGFWIVAPPILYLCIRHAVIRRRETWSVRDRRVAYSAAALTFILTSLWTSTVKSDREVEESIFKGREIVYAIKDYHQRNQRLPAALNDLVPVYFTKIPETEVPEGWSGREDYVYKPQGKHRFTVSFESASYASCVYDRTIDRWDCR
jgi:hypothetical protein